MTMTDTKPKSVCLICLKRFGGETVKNGSSNNGAATPAPQSSLSILESYLRMKQNTKSVSVDTDDDGKNQSGSCDLYSKFLHLTCRYLKVSASEAFLTFAKEHKRNTGKSVDVFCQRCQVFVGSVCDLYGELQVIKLKLLGKVEELESVTRQSVKTVSSKLVRVLFKALAEQLNVKTVTRLELFRKNIILSCRRKVQGCPPQVLVPRGLLPEQWTCTYSATKLVLMRLIIIFALAAAPPASQEKISEETEGDTISVENDDNAHHFKKMRSKRRTAYSQNKNAKGIQDEDDHFETDDHDNSGNVPNIGGGDENDSDWSVGAASLPEGPDSPESHASYNIIQHDEKVTFTQLKPPKKSRTQRLALGLVQVICEEDDDTATDDSDFQRAIENQLKQLQSINPDDPDLVCKLCKHAYPNTWRLGHHLKRVHSILNPYHCSTCALEFKSANEVTTHRRAMHPQDYNKRLTCPKCPERKFTFKRALTKHLQMAHQMALTCKLCDYKSMSYGDLQKHNTKMHTTTRGKGKPLNKTATKIIPAHKCNFCSVLFKTTAELAGHKRKVHPEKIHCPKCPGRRVFHNKHGLAMHMWRCHKSNLQHVCSVCGYKGQSSGALLAHKSRAHRKRIRIAETAAERQQKRAARETDKYANVPCEVCQATFESGPCLRKHLNMEHEHKVREEEKIVPCTICLMKFAYQQTMELHVAASHLRRYRFVCDAEECSEHFSQKSQLNTHIENVHLLDSECQQVKLEPENVGDDKITKVKCVSYCKTCNCAFVSADMLKLHELTHVHRDKDRMYPCPDCPKKTPVLSKLVTHFNLEHGKHVEIFKCLECPAAFKGENAYRRHVLSHHNKTAEEKSILGYRCPHCPQRRFSMPATLASHMRFAHHFCTLCDYKADDQQQLLLHRVNVHMKKKAREKYRKIAGTPVATGLHAAARRSKRKVARIILPTTQTRAHSKIPESLKQRLEAVDSTDIEMYTGVPCQVCNSVFESGPSLRAHLNVEHEQKVVDAEKTISCSICCTKFAFEQTYELHYLVQHLRAYPFVCDVASCYAHFLNRSDLNAHLEAVHLEDPGNEQRSTETVDSVKVKSISYCPTCNSGFASPYALQLHQLTHKLKNNFPHYPCPACEEQRCSIVGVVAHYNTAHGNNLKLFKCLECHEKFFNRDRQRYHIRNHNTGKILKLVTERKEKARQKQEGTKLKKEDPVYKQQNYKMPESLKSRIEAKDPDGKTDSELYTGVPCQVCSAVFESGPRLRAHLNKEHEQVPDKEKAVTCSICCSKFAHEQTYELHYLVQHLGAYTFVCDAESCQEHFLNCEELNAHLENVHLKKPGENDQSQSTTTPQQVDKVESISYCVICNWGFVNPYFFKLHELVHEIRQRFDKNCYPCPACPLKKASVMAVVGHYNTSHGKKLPNWKCLECPKKYFYQESLQHHIRNVNRSKILEAGVERGAESGFVCSECGEPYSDVAKLRWHILKEHNASAGYFVCPAEGCERAYANKKIFRGHSTVCRHSGNKLVRQQAGCGQTKDEKRSGGIANDEGKFVCPEAGCGQEFKSWMGLRNHEKKHKSKREKKMRPGNKFVCTQGGCGLEFKTKYAFLRHQIKHRGSKYVPCPEVGCRQTIVQERLHVHRERVHASRVICSTLCSICGMSFRDENTRNQHERWVHRPAEFECDICHKKYKRKAALQQHQVIHNPDPQTYTIMCQECGSTFTTEGGLRHHLNSKHTPQENKKFACSHCQYRTHRPVLLKSHLRTCLKNLGLPWDEEKYGKLPASLSKYTGPPRKPGRKPGWNKRKRDDEHEEEEMEDKSTTENESSEEEEEKTEPASIGASCNEQKQENAPSTCQVGNNQQQQHENKVYSQPAPSHIINYPDL